MKLQKALMVGIAACVLAAPAWSDETKIVQKLYEYGGEKFEVLKPEKGKMAVTGKELTAYITIHKATGMYREVLDGWGSDHNTLKDAMDGACRRILDKANKPSNEALLKGLDEFYESL